MSENLILPYSNNEPAYIIEIYDIYEIYTFST